MTDAKKNAEQLAETWLEAMSILSKKQIESVSFDKTVEATVTDATRASEGIYVVSTGNASFTAYTTEVGYKNNDAVMVTIPQGNYDKQKIIIGKQVSKQDGPIIYKSPFEKIIDVTNNIIQGEYQVGYWANGADYKWEAQPGYCIKPYSFTEVMEKNGTRYYYRKSEETEQDKKWYLLESYTPVEVGYWIGQKILARNSESVSNKFNLQNPENNILNWFEYDEGSEKYTNFQTEGSFVYSSDNRASWSDLTSQTEVEPGYWIGQREGNDITNQFRLELANNVNHFITNWFEKENNRYKIKKSALEEILQLGRVYYYATEENSISWTLLTKESSLDPNISYWIGQKELEAIEDGNNIAYKFQLEDSKNNILNWFEYDNNQYTNFQSPDNTITFVYSADGETNWQVLTSQTTEVEPGYWIARREENNNYTNQFQLSAPDKLITNWFFFNNGLPETTIKPFYNNTRCFYQNFSRLGLRAQFSTWLGEYDTIQGNYGLAIVLTFSYSVGDVNQEFSKVIQFDSNEFLGDPYNFETFYTQEQVFDISDFKDYPIVGIKLYAYQKNNFKSIDGNRIPAPDEDDFSIINPNIFVKSPYICLGNSVDDFQTDTAEIMCDTALTYYKTATGQQQNRDEDNKKTIQLRWIHKDTNTDIIKVVEDDVLPDNYEIRWYRYQAGAPSPDQFAGAHWQRFYGIKKKAEPTTGEWVCSQEDGDTATNSTEIIFEPNVNRQEEKIKAIIIKNEAEIISRLITSSNVLTFTNDNEVRNKVTLIDANALSIKFEDDEKGHYFLYDESGEIGKNEDTEVRILTAVFDERKNGEQELDVYKKAKLNVDDCSKVVWTFPDPSANTMIIPMTEANENASVLNELDENGLYTRKDCESVGFTIKKWLNNNATQNRIRLDITKDGQDYSAWVDPIFGTAGDNGSDYKVVLTWRNGKNALNLSKDNNVFLEPYIENIENNDVVHNDQTALIGDVVIFDQAGDVVDWPEDATLEANWLVAEFGSSSIKQKEKEEESILYPIFSSRDSAIINNESGNNDYYYQGHNKDNSLNDYYFIVESIPDENSNSYYKLSIDTNVDPNKTYFKKNNNNNYYYCTISEGNPSSNGFYEYVGNYKYFDLTENKFKPCPGGIYTQIDNENYVQRLYQRYRSLRSNEQKKNKLEFKQVIFTEENIPLDQETGTYKTNYLQDTRDAITFNSNSKVYAYSKKQRYFIKINDQYILDPWEDYQEVETYYEPIEAKEKVYTLDSVGNAVGGLTAAAVNQTVTITASTDISMDSLFILQLTLKNFGDYNLVSYYPIALKNGETRENKANQGEDPLWQMTRVIQYIEGPDRVRYGSSGETDFKKNPYQISVIQFDDNEEKFIQYRHGFNDNEENTNSSPPYNYNGYWKLLFPHWDDGKENIFKPILKETAIDASTHTVKEVIEERYDIPLLNPISVYIPDALPYGIQFIGYDSNNNEVTLWTQPILVYQNKYPSRTLNKWNGKDIETDDGAGTITASGFAAGRKERDDNTFTGVVIGDWSRSKADTVITKNTGVYGFNHGAMSYAFKDDGTGFIGKDGSGRIYFDGNKSLIYSSKWKSFPGAQGMLLDIDDGVIDIRGPFVGEDQTQAQIYISPNQGRYLNIKDESGNDLLKISNNNYYLQTSNFSTGQKTGVKLDLSSGRFTGYDFLIHAVKSSDILPNGYIDINSGDTSYPLQIGIVGSSPNFKVDWYGTLNAQNATIEGNITANSGKIGNWFIAAQNDTENDYNVYYDPNSYLYRINPDDTTGLTPISTFQRRGSIHNNGAVMLSTDGIFGASIYGGNIFGSYISGGVLAGGILKAINTTNKMIKLNGYLQVEPLSGFSMPNVSFSNTSDSNESSRSISYFGYATSGDTKADSLNDYTTVDTNDGISMRTLVVAEGDEQTVQRVQEVKSTGKNAGMSSTTTVTNGFTGQVTSYVSVYSTTPSAKMDTVFRTSANDGTSSSSFVRTHMNGVTLLSKNGTITRGRIDIYRVGDDVIIIQVGNSNIKIGTSNGTETITINTGGTVNITGRTINLNKPEQVAVDEIPSLSTNFLPGEQTGIYARFA